jgi:hypothetical protein
VGHIKEVGLKRFIILGLILFLVFGIVLVAKEGSCVEYAHIVCDICGKNSDVCKEIIVKSAEHPEDDACKKGVRLLPTVYKKASEKDKLRIRRTLCDREIGKESKK